MAIDWNADVGEVWRQLLAGGSGASASTQGQGGGSLGVALLWPLMLVLVVLLYLYLLYLPVRAEIETMQGKVEQIPRLELQRIQLLALQKRNREAGAQATVDVGRLHQMMFAHREVDQLYREIQQLAKLHTIEVKVLKKLSVDPVAKAVAEQGKRRKQSPPPEPLFYRIRLTIEMQGDFLRYLAMREAMLDFGKMLQVDREQIRTVTPEKSPSSVRGGSGAVTASMELSLYQIDTGDPLSKEQ